MSLVEAYELCARATRSTGVIYPPQPDDVTENDTFDVQELFKQSAHAVSATSLRQHSSLT